MSWRFVLHDRRDFIEIVDDNGDVRWEGCTLAAFEMLAKTLEVCHDVADSSWLIDAANKTLTFLNSQKEAAEDALRQSAPNPP